MMRMRCVLLIALLAACAGGEGGDGGASDAAMDVNVVTAVRDTMPVLIEAIGVVTPRPQGVAELTSPGATRVLAIRVGVGDAVRRGRSMMSLDSSVWQAELADAEAAVSAAKQGLDRANRLVEQGIMPRREAEQAAADLARAQAGLASARLRRSLADVRSPINGVVDRISVSLDQIVAEGDPLVRVVDPAAMEISFRVAPDAASRIRAGMPAAIVSSASDSATASARIIAVAPGIDAGTGAVIVRASIDRGARVFRSGEVVNGRIEAGRHADAIVIPRAALVDATNDEATVFLIGDDGLAHAQSVRLGARTADRVEVLEGLEVGARIVGDGAYSVRDSARISPRAGS
jgi:membrane fusion protein, multidrug efflux system